MARTGRAARFTIYDVMEAKGVFEDNPANASSPQYKGPQEYPKMLYHPKGEERVTQKAEILATPMGPIRVGEQKEIIYRIVMNEEDDKSLRAVGWHDHPAKAIAASGKEAPPMTSSNRIEELEKEIARLMRERDMTKPVEKKAAAA